MNIAIQALQLALFVAGVALAFPSRAIPTPIPIPIGTSMRKSHGLRIQDPWLRQRRALRVYVRRAILLPVFGEECRVII